MKAAMACLAPVSSMEASAWPMPDGPMVWVQSLSRAGGSALNVHGAGWWGGPAAPLCHRRGQRSAQLRARTEMAKLPQEDAARTDQRGPTTGATAGGRGRRQPAEWLQRPSRRRGRAVHVWAGFSRPAARPRAVAAVHVG